MANTAAFLVDRVFPDVPVRQYVLTLPYELRKLVAFKADVLTAVGRIFVDSVFASYRTRAKRDGIAQSQFPSGRSRRRVRARHRGPACVPSGFTADGG